MTSEVSAVCETTIKSPCARHLCLFGMKREFESGVLETLPVTFLDRGFASDGGAGGRQQQRVIFVKCDDALYVRGVIGGDDPGQNIFDLRDLARAVFSAGRGRLEIANRYSAQVFADYAIQFSRALEHHVMSGVVKKDSLDRR